MPRSGKELKVFTVKRGDLQKFTQEAKKYGVFLLRPCRPQEQKDPNAEVDVIARAEDASKISRIVERLPPWLGETPPTYHTGEKSKDTKDSQPEPETPPKEKKGKKQTNPPPGEPPSQKKKTQKTPHQTSTEKARPTHPTPKQSHKTGGQQR